MLATAAAATSAPATPPQDQSYQFRVERAQGALYNPWTGKDDPVELRSFRGSGISEGAFVAPTIRIAPGRQLTIDIDNRLEPCTAEQAKEQRCFNDTNLHTHGLWVSPSGNSDNVLISIPPGEKFRYQYQVPADHPAGTFWYHPHRHGSGFVQVGSGMAGALIVTGDRKPTLDRPGDIDILLKDAKGRAFPERVMIFQQIQYGCLDDKGKIQGRLEKVVEKGVELEEYVAPWLCPAGAVGRIESDDHDVPWNGSGRFTGINGKVQPVLEPARAGRFERWRLIHGGTRERVGMRLLRLAEGAPDLRGVRAADQEAWIKRHCTGPALPMWQIAMDGLTRSAVRRTDVALLFPGERLDVLARFPSAGRYCLVQNATVLFDRPQPLRVLALIDAKGGASSSADADAELQALMVQAAGRTLAGSGQAPVRDKVIGDLRDGLKLAAFTWHKPVADKEVAGYREALLNIIVTPNSALFHVNGRPFDHGRTDMVLPLGKAEEWHAISLLGAHPLHMHVNPFQIVRIQNSKGDDVTDPKGPAFDPDYAGLIGEWKDTIFLKQDLRVAFRTRYERFTGDFVTHCHIMFHGDHGMMLKLSIADGGEGPKVAQHAAH
ncbi:MAG TPA: multicopper oxidase family protein [Sphingomicrobium sp.]|nr:multicopper oxidase family protein [Sphingomicrobium sp.]